MRKLFQVPEHLKYPVKNRIVKISLVVFLTAAVVGLVCGLVVRRLNTTLHEQQQERMAYLEMSLDQQLGSLGNTAGQIVADSYLQILARTNAPLTAHQRSVLVAFNREFKQYVAANTLWANTMLYCTRSELYQEGGFSRAPEELYKTWGYQISMQEWQNLLHATSLPAWYTFDTENGIAVEAWYPLNLSSSQEDLGVLIIRLNRNELLGFLSGMRSSAEERMLLVDGAGSVLCDTGSRTPEDQYSRAEIVNARTGWRLVSLLDTNALEAPARFCMLLSLILCAGILLLGIAAGIIYAVRSTAPMERLLTMASENRSWDRCPHTTREAYDLLETNFRALIEHYDTAQLKLLHQERYVRDHLLSRLLNATWAGESAYSPDIFQENGLSFSSENLFLLRVLCLNPEETQEIFQIRLNQMLEEVLSEPYNARFFLYDMNNLGIVSLPDGMAFSDAAEEIRTSCLRLSERLKQAENVRLVFLCSSRSVPVTQLPTLYQEMTEAEDYYDARPKEGAFLLTSDIVADDSAHSGMIKAVRSQLWQAVEKEDYAQAVALIQQVYGQDKKQYGEASAVLFCTVLNMAGITMTAMQINSDSEEGGLTERLHAPQRLLACSTVHALYTELIQLLTEASASAEERTAPRSRILYEVRSYVDAHYTDENLSVSELADRAGMSISSLSRAFKREMGYNLLDYINKLRVEAVMHSLTESEDTLEKIAERTGYINVNTLIRNFKRYVGMTPGKYKQSLAGNSAPAKGG